MECGEARKRLADLSLDDLDVEERRAVEAHLASCAACRSARDGVERTLGALRAAPPVDSSSQRRERAVAALAAEHERRVEAAMFARSGRGLRRGILSAAAALLLAAGGTLMIVMSHSGAAVDLRVEALEGAVRTFPAGGAGWRDLAEKDRVRDGDRVMCDQGAKAVFALREDGRDVGRITTDAGTSFLLQVESGGLLRRIVLDRGGVRAELAGARGETRVTVPSGEELVARDGRFNAKLVDTLRIRVMPWKEKRDGPRKDPQTLRMDRSGASQRLEVRVSRGSATLQGRQGSIEVGEGYDGAVDAEGVPVRQPAGPGGEGLQVALPQLRVTSAGRDADGRPVLDCVVEPGAVLAEVEGGRLWVSVEGESAQRLRLAAEGEAELRLRVKFSAGEKD